VIVAKVGFDAEACVWFIETSQVHGLRLEAPILDILIARIPAAIQDLLEDHDDFVGRDIPIEVIAHANTGVCIRRLA
jgi:hypothetical protein